MIVRHVWATHRFQGMHAWTDAPPHRRYLADPHRHLFHVRVEVSVVHDSREIEFHDLLDLVASICDAMPHDALGSCEDIAHDIADEVQVRWPKRRVSADVSEDGENGATIVLLP